MHKKCRCTGGRQGGSNFAANMARFTHAGDNHFALTVKEDLASPIKGGVQRCQQTIDGGGFNFQHMPAKSGKISLYHGGSLLLCWRDYM